MESEKQQKLAMDLAQLRKDIERATAILGTLIVNRLSMVSGLIH